MLQLAGSLPSLKHVSWWNITSLAGSSNCCWISCGCCINPICFLVELQRVRYLQNGFCCIDDSTWINPDFCSISVVLAKYIDSYDEGVGRSCHIRIFVCLIKKNNAHCLTFPCLPVNTNLFWFNSHLLCCLNSQMFSLRRLKTSFFAHGHLWPNCLPLDLGKSKT